jgi:tRNA 2-thiouridine synthesizing protein A
MQPDRILDCTGLFCPMPIVKTSSEMNSMKSGEVLEISADDPGFEKDLPAWCKMSGQEFIEIKKEGRTLKGYVRKK